MEVADEMNGENYVRKRSFERRGMSAYSEGFKGGGGGVNSKMWGMHVIVHLRGCK